MAPRKKMSGVDKSEDKVVVEKEVKKPFKIDQDKDTKFRYEFNSWIEYNKFKGEKA